ncbi:hypothetical protein CJ483_01440 [Bacillus sp. PK3_68]|nr:hypothetical protein CJ483_01440 [Bacillus sp. PK3_68]
MSRIVWIIMNVVTGLFVAFSSFIGFLISGIADTDEPTNDYRILIWLLVWIIGLVLQYKLETRLLGIIISLIPAVYFIYVYISVIYVAPS